MKTVAPEQLYRSVRDEAARSANTGLPEWEALTPVDWMIFTMLAQIQGELAGIRRELEKREHKYPCG